MFSIVCPLKRQNFAFHSKIYFQENIISSCNILVFLFYDFVFTSKERTTLMMGRVIVTTTNTIARRDIAALSWFLWKRGREKKNRTILLIYQSEIIFFHFNKLLNSPFLYSVAITATEISARFLFTRNWEYILFKYSIYIKILFERNFSFLLI